GGGGGLTEIAKIVGGERGQAVAREGIAADIADRDFRASGEAAVEEDGDAAGESGIVERITDEDRFGVGGRAVEEIGGERGYGDGIEGGVEREGGESVGVGMAAATPDAPESAAAMATRPEPVP